MNITEAKQTGRLAYRMTAGGVFKFLMMLLAFHAVVPAFAQNTGFSVPQDTVAETDLEYVPREKAGLFKGRPGRAALYSLILPGAGQAYNKKYWQVPIVWAGVGTAAYIVRFNSRQYNDWDDAYRDHVIAAEEGVPPSIYPTLTTQQVLNERDRWNRYRQLSIIGLAAVWLANSAQAYVSAHLKDFDIDEDLSLHIAPLDTGAPMGSTSLGATVTLKF